MSLPAFVETIRAGAQLARMFSGGSPSGPGTPQRAASEQAFYNGIRDHAKRGKPANTDGAYMAAMTADCSAHRDQASCQRLKQIAAKARADGEADYRAVLNLPVQGNATAAPLIASSGAPLAAVASTSINPLQRLLLLLLLLLGGGGNGAR